MSDARRMLRDLWKPNGKINRINERHIRKALKASDVEELSISYFIHLPEYKRYHGKVLEAVKSTIEV